MQPCPAFCNVDVGNPNSICTLASELSPRPLYVEIFQLMFDICLRIWTGDFVFQYSTDLFLLSVLLLIATDFMDTF